jgi:NAD+ diphosphatase
MPQCPIRPPHIYAATGLDRVAHRRRDDAWLHQRRDDPATRVVFLSALRIPILGASDAPRLYAPNLAELDVPLPEDSIFLGEFQGAAWFAVDQGDRPMPAAELVELRTVSLLLPAGEAGLLAYARGLAHWHQGHRFCGWCGAETLATQAGHARHCPGCGRDNFPRTDPAVIVLVTHGDQCLLGRSSRFPPGMYSTLAGFVEPGESLEDTLRREVFEEVGVEIDGLVYRASQPWPFPQSLMLGFRAHALRTELVIDQDEIEDAAWFDRVALAEESRRPVRLPNSDSIARFLLEEWLAETG